MGSGQSSVIGFAKSMDIKELIKFRTNMNFDPEEVNKLLQKEFDQLKMKSAAFQLNVHRWKDECTNLQTCFANSFEKCLHTAFETLHDTAIMVLHATNNDLNCNPQLGNGESSLLETIKNCRNVFDKLEDLAQEIFQEYSNETQEVFVKESGYYHTLEEVKQMQEKIEFESEQAKANHDSISEWISEVKGRISWNNDQLVKEEQDYDNLDFFSKLLANREDRRSLFIQNRANDELDLKELECVQCIIERCQQHQAMMIDELKDLTKLLEMQYSSLKQETERDLIIKKMSVSKDIVGPVMTMELCMLSETITITKNQCISHILVLLDALCKSLDNDGWIESAKRKIMDNIEGYYTLEQLEELNGDTKYLEYEI